MVFIFGKYLVLMDIIQQIVEEEVNN